MTNSLLKPWNLIRRSVPRRTVLKGMGAGAAAVLAGPAAPRLSLAQVEGGLGTGWTHLVGGGGSLLFYNANTGAGLAGTIDNGGWHEGETYSDFSQDWQLVVATSAGSVLMIDPSSGQGAGGIIADGAWSYLTDYSDFSSGWTHAVATRDSVLLYDQDSGQGAGGTLIDGEWSYLTDYSDFSTGYTHLTGSDDSILLYDASSGFGATGTLIDGTWEWIGEYDDFSTDWSLQVGSGDSLLLVEQDTGIGAGGILEGGTWEWINEYEGFSIGWTHVASAGNGFVLFYDADSGLGAWGTLDGGTWEYYGNPVGEPGTGGIPEIDDLAEAFLEETAVPGLSIAIAKDGNLVYAKGYGVADPDTGESVTTESRFRIASVSKTFTSAAILRLVEEGELNLDDVVFGEGGALADYGTKEHTADVDTITIEHLLTHTGGGWSNAAPDPMYEEPNLDADELITWVLDERKLDTDPGTNYAYSNFGYCALGRVIEHTTGQSYDEYVQEAILDPCGISSMAIAGNTLDERQENEVVYDDSNTPASFGKPYEIPVSRMDAHGGWIGTATDLLRFVTRVDGFDTIPDILGGDTIDTMTTPTDANPIDADPGYGMGWTVNEFDNWWHNGNLAGTEAFLVRSSDGICWAALANGNGINLETVVWAMIKKVGTWPTGEPL
jgi:CubicO group peptidase (beta-lactamase class C family)